MYSYASRTMCDSLPAARHDAVTQLDDLGNADYLLGVVSLIRQQHQEEKDVGNDGLGIPAKVPYKKKKRIRNGIFTLVKYSGQI